MSGGPAGPRPEPTVQPQVIPPVTVPGDPAADEPALYRVTLWLCGLCMTGKGGECHSPGCSLWINRAPDIPITHDADGRRIVLLPGDAAEVARFREQCERALAEADGGA